MEKQLYWIDAFADQLFTGNPAAVCLSSRPIDKTTMQKIAQEIGLSETAFVVVGSDGIDLRWFTPKTEVDLCGHATLASAHALWESQRVRDYRSIQFRTRSGALTAEKKGDLIYLDFPAFSVCPTSQAPAGLFKALGIEPVDISIGENAILLEVGSEKILRSMRPDFELLKRIPTDGLIATCRSSGSAYDFVSRYFGPREGINEDPVTGFAHCHLGPYWRSKLNKVDFIAYQASSRGGYVRVHVRGARVSLGGKAITIMKGTIPGAVFDKGHAG